MTIADLITTSFGSRAFTSLWFYVLQLLVLAYIVANPLFIPRWLTQHAREDDVAAQNLLSLIRFRKAQFLSREYSIVFIVLFSFCAVFLVFLGFVARVEWAQALLLIVVPAVLIIEKQRHSLTIEPGLDTLQSVLGYLHRLQLNSLLIGVCAILITLLLGFLRNWAFLFG